MFVNLLTHRLYVRLKLDLTPQAIAEIKRKIVDSVNYFAAICMYVIINAGLISLLGFKGTYSHEFLQSLAVGERIIASDFLVPAVYFVSDFNFVAMLTAVIFACAVIACVIVRQVGLAKSKSLRVRYKRGKSAVVYCGGATPYYKLHSKFLC